ncbi:Acg family FMN-binding oxidoreductase [Frankia sp. AgKG'84/4]|uniref:Acg family FMN-binding oxidoreductase n=1 Tax=Frankia sp. AgKG'84/4 TaxID=573490 RepID=UPI00200D3DEA|nr:nitroreductase family protein [Frankia sp. AgKG'84/4]MCL9798307.1 nitroreductase family protein [Frankia sp. AgKG'84/4]
MAASTTTLTIEQARTAVEAAILAPSIHNSQPWRWRLDGDCLDLFADLTRAVPVVDPHRRQMVMSCGAALFNAWLTLRAAGLEVQVDELPDGTDLATDRLATLRVVGQCPPAQGDAELATAINRRHTDRRPFDQADLPDEVLHGLRRAAESEGCWLAPVVRTETRVELSVLLARADWVETHDPDYRAELMAWSRTDPNALDGVPRSAVVGSDEPRQSEFPLRDFDIVGEAGQRLRDPQVERPGVLVLGSDGDDTAAWLHAGRALGRLLLVATAAGLAASPLGQAIDVDATRALLREATGGIGQAQMILRVGYPDPAAPTLPQTPRRPACDLLEVVHHA